MTPVALDFPPNSPKQSPYVFGAGYSQWRKVSAFFPSRQLSGTGIIFYFFAQFSQLF
jgi:hypothetical protein